MYHEIHFFRYKVVHCNLIENKHVQGFIISVPNYLYEDLVFKEWKGWSDEAS